MRSIESNSRVGIIDGVRRGASVVALGGALAVAGCQAQEQPYSGGETKLTVEAGVDVYDETDGLNSGNLKACGKTAESATALPVDEDVTTGNAAGNGEVLQYSFKIGEAGLPLKAGHSCEGEVWVYKNQTTPAN